MGQSGKQEMAAAPDAATAGSSLSSPPGEHGAQVAGLLDLTTSSDRDKAKRAFEAMMTMVKIDVARIEAAAEAA